MKVLHVAWEASKYGIWTFLLDLLTYQKSMSADLKVAAVFHASNREGERELTSRMITCYSLKAKKALDIKLFYGFYKLFKNYDIITLHTHSPIAFFVAKILGKRVVYMFHGYAGIKKAWTDILVKLYLRYLLSPFCDYIIFASLTSLKRYEWVAGNLKRKINYSIIPYGHILKDIRTHSERYDIRCKLGWTNKFVFGTAARFDPVKRLEYLLEAMHSLKTKKEYILAIAGNGEKEYELYLKKLARKYNISERVCFLGYIENICDIIAAMDLFVLPTYKESFGLALIEAMTLGIPCVVFIDGGGAVDIIGNSGFIVDSVEELSIVVEKLQKDDYLRSRISHKVKERARLFDICFTAKKLYNIYNNILK